MTLEEKHLQAITNNVREISAWEAEGIEGQDLAAKECAKITLQHCIDVIRDIGNNAGDTPTWKDLMDKQAELEKKLSEI